MGSLRIENPGYRLSDYILGITQLREILNASLLVSRTKALLLKPLFSLLSWYLTQSMRRWKSRLQTFTTCFIKRRRCAIAAEYDIWWTRLTEMPQSSQLRKTSHLLFALYQKIMMSRLILTSLRTGERWVRRAFLVTLCSHWFLFFRDAWRVFFSCQNVLEP